MDGTKKLSTAIGFGIITLLILASIISMVIALLLKFTAMTEGTLAVTIFILALLSMLISGFTAGKKAQGKGWLVGFTTGLTFAILVFLVNYLGFSQTLSNSQLLYQLALMGASTLGGIFGVNMSKQNN
ncbi:MULTISPECIES: TIGR04086 family membrane protein [Bacillus]|uniref:TIGR04086 family membrane protein n=1 Tax=Bacillus wiedmannii TaxID=1890302 RepID=A0A2B6UXL9_9BACI|nr:MULTISPECIES: TIGR04086 family membrane protein [Bacillus]EJS71275.1 TIGR04097 family integral membrane protein [Bacillus wiedmannii]EJV59658.1 TIGR04097 family integral membrane protein [Bacillus wiedmannii]MDF9662144.1 TIGR04086 family membrane protein [Bacillus wiedmannii]MDI6504787.1 TIGR04086 family membrane protein [Bacillus wiedmannii]MDI6509655.1 TIGR04086 family membrane protein [Bacillus wiedmannii]